MNIAAPFSCYAAALPTVSEALALVSARFSPVRDRQPLPLSGAADRIVAQDIRAAVTMPPWDRSAMDGYAFPSGDTGPLRLIGRAMPARHFAGVVQNGECVTIATGAKLPQGCDTVAMREHCTVSDGFVRLDSLARAGANVRRRGEDFAAGAILLAAGTKLDARHLALLASAGVTQISAVRRLRVAILSIGDELSADAFFDANRPMLMALCAGADVSDLGILPDRRDTIAAALTAAARAHDVIISSAGTSMGDEDHARGALLDCGGEVLVAGVAIKPGKPVTFGRIGDCLHIGLPGNPAAALITFLALGAPLLRHLTGEPPPRGQAVCAGFHHRKKKGLREFLRVILDTNAGNMPRARRMDRDGAAMLLSLAHADGLICLDESVTEITPGMTLPYYSFAELIRS